MDELYPLFAVMIVTVAVLFGLMGFFRRWVNQRDRLLSVSSQPASTLSQPIHRQAA